MARKNNKQKRARRVGVILEQEREEEKKKEEAKKRRAENGATRKRKRDEMKVDHGIPKQYLTFGEENLGKGKEKIEEETKEKMEEDYLYKDDNRGGKRRRIGK